MAEEPQNAPMLFVTDAIKKPQIDAKIEALREVIAMLQDRITQLEKERVTPRSDDYEHRE